MNKFSKTSYSRHFNHENFMNSSHQANQRKIQNEEIDHSKNKFRFHEQDNSKPLHSLIERKIQIDPTLLLTSKPHQWQGRTIKGEKSQTGNRELSSTVTDGFMKKVRERPESKKESRIKIMQNSSLNKRKQDTIQRPQTSKGQRNVVYNRQTRKTLNNEDDHEIEVRRESKTSFGTRRRNTSKQIELQTSIDPQFLALFAN